MWLKQPLDPCIFMSAQQFEWCTIARDTSRGGIGVRKPMLNVSRASNNRAGSFIGGSLSATAIPRREILDPPSMNIGAGLFSMVVVMSRFVR